MLLSLFLPFSYRLILSSSLAFDELTGTTVTERPTVPAHGISLHRVSAASPPRFAYQSAIGPEPLVLSRQAIPQFGMRVRRRSLLRLFCSFPISHSQSISIFYFSVISHIRLQTPHLFPHKMAPVRLAILEADRPAYKSITSQGHYTGVFTALLRAATAPVPLEAIFTVTGHNIIEHPDTEYPPLDEVDAILISGSKYSAYQDDPWILKLVEYTEKAIASERVRVVGVCFGHQIVGRALGCVVQGSPEGWEVAVYEVPLSEKGKEVFGMEKIVCFPLSNFGLLILSPSSFLLSGFGGFCGSMLTWY